MQHRLRTAGQVLGNVPDPLDRSPTPHGQFQHHVDKRQRGSAHAHMRPGGNLREITDHSRATQSSGPGLRMPRSDQDFIVSLLRIAGLPRIPRDLPASRNQARILHTLLHVPHFHRLWQSPQQPLPRGLQEPSNFSAGWKMTSLWVTNGKVSHGCGDPRTTQVHQPIIGLIQPVNTPCPAMRFGLPHINLHLSLCLG